MKLLNTKFSLFSIAIILGFSCFLNVKAMEPLEEEFSTKEVHGLSAKEAFEENAGFLFGRHFNYDYGLRKNEHDVHVMAMGIGHEFYTGVTLEDFEKFVRESVQTHQCQFKSTFEHNNIRYSPLGAIFGPDCLKKPWRGEQIKQAQILFNIYGEYEPPVPSAEIGGDTYGIFHISLLHTILGQETCSRTQYFVDYYKAYFEKNIETRGNEEEFLKYAYAFFQMKDPQNPALQKIHPRKIDPTQGLNSLYNQRIEDPYQNLEKLLKSKDKWRMCMDYCQQRMGKNGEDYDKKEPGTIASLLRGFDYILNNREEISYEYINTLWNIALQHREEIDQRGQRFGCHFPETTLNFMLSFKERYGHVATLAFTPVKDFTFVPFIFMESPLTPSLSKFNEKLAQAIKVYLEWSLDPNCPAEFKKDAEQQCLMLMEQYKKFSAKTKEQVIEFTDKFHHVNRNTLSTFAQKVLAAIDLVQSLEVTHEHLDGNARTNVTLLLNKLLMDLKLPPSIFEYPMAIDGKTPEESLNLLIKGMENYREVERNIDL